MKKCIPHSLGKPYPPSIHPYNTNRKLHAHRGDFQSIKEVCLDSLQGSLRSKIGNRHPKERLKWTLHRYIGRPRIVSTKIGKLPFDESAIYQVVVKVKSMQSLEKMIREPGKKSDVVSDEEKGVPKRVTEYVVLQKSLLRGHEVPWKIWGMTEENKSENVLREGSPSNLATAV